MLDISSADKGLLIPRMVIIDPDSDLLPIESPATGLLIYNTGSAQVSEGFYTWSGNSWIEMISSTSNLTIEQISPAYESAELYESNGYSTPTSISLPSCLLSYGWVNAAVGAVFGSMTTDITDLSADKIIIGESGLYQIIISASFGGSNNNQVMGSVFCTPEEGAASTTRIKFISRIQNTPDIVSASTHGVLELNKGDAIDIRFSSNSDNENVDIYILNLSATKVGNL
ncbi:MAG: hypothetical protein HQ565_10225 [Bacteroidetes bacterium]|nr:hypothetical protein [Bacteroidota bacterium]